MSTTVKQMTSRRGALKRTDGEALTRYDLQFELLSYIFNDTNAVFTDPFTDPPGKKVTFRDLYVSAIVAAPKTARSVREKFAESPLFATEFAMLSLLANVGRVNTSMAFFPETRTALRTYHPVPALQKSEGNLTDAPRIRNALKSCILPTETKHVPNSPFNILQLREGGPIPTTSVVNLLFVLSQHTSTVGSTHFSSESGLEFNDLFQPVPVPSAERGRAFLWIVYHYLESTGSPNPFLDSSDPASDTTQPNFNPSAAPKMQRVEPSVLAEENVDTQEEKDWGVKMQDHRVKFLATDRERHDAVMAASAREEPGPSERGTSGTPTPSAVKPIKSRGKPGQKAFAVTDGSTPIKGRPRNPQKDQQESISRKTSHQLLQLSEPLTLAPSAGAPYPNLQPVPAPGSANLDATRTLGTGKGTGRGRRLRHAQPTTLPYEKVYVQPEPERSMLQQAWHVVTTKDVLHDSDDDEGDEHLRLDYSRRLQTINRLRGKSPTPTPEPESRRGLEMDYQMTPPVMDVEDGW